MAFPFVVVIVLALILMLVLVAKGIDSWGKKRVEVKRAWMRDQKSNIEGHLDRAAIRMSVAETRYSVLYTFFDKSTPKCTRALTLNETFDLLKKVDGKPIEEVRGTILGPKYVVSNFGVAE